MMGGDPQGGRSGDRVIDGGGKGGDSPQVGQSLFQR